MNKIKRKNYTLFLKLNGKKIELLKGTLSEIDDFTTHFLDSNALYKKITDKNVENSKYEIFITSSKNNRYQVLYYKYRKLLNSSNVNQIMAYLKQLKREELISFLYNYTLIVYYTENSLEDNKIPLCELYNNLIAGLDYNSSLNKFIKSDYKNYRLAAMYIINNYNLKLIDFPFSNINDLKQIILDIRKVVQNSLSKNNEETMPNFNASNDDLLSGPETLDERIYSIINNNILDTYEKEEELELLIDDADKLRIAKDMLYQKKM